MAREMKDSGIEWIGIIPETWDIIKFKYVFSIIGGNGFPDSLQGNTQGDYPFCKVSDINGQNEYVETAANWVTQEIVDLNKFNIIPPNSILMAKIGAALAKNHRKINALKCCIDNNTQALVLKRNDSIRYLFYLSKCLDMSWFDNNSTVPSINNNRLLNFFIPNISCTEQEKISSYLDAQCACIDAVIEKTQTSIEEYKKLKQAVITQAVTKGIRPNRSMKDSGVDWLGKVPADWNVYRIANLYDERNESGEDSLPILSVSINTGISDHEVADEEQARIFVRSEDKSKYKRVYPGDLAYNMMRAWQGAFGAVRVDGMVSPAYVVAKPKHNINLDSRYMEALLRTPSAIEEMHRYSHGITDFRLRLYWPEFKNIRVCIPSIDEQKEISDFIDKTASDVDTMISRKKQLLTEMESYKKSLIFEYITGKREIK
ncbi:MAG: restriction endonuclease subunit S [Clostridia bacterium]|nr:restriction endonuclease subunit S [Clostridia bacterium]